jgi:hypothetical protein
VPEYRLTSGDADYDFNNIDWLNRLRPTGYAEGSVVNGYPVITIDRENNIINVLYLPELPFILPPEIIANITDLRIPADIPNMPTEFILIKLQPDGDWDFDFDDFDFDEDMWFLFDENMVPLGVFVFPEDIDIDDFDGWEGLFDMLVPLAGGSGFSFGRSDETETGELIRIEEIDARLPEYDEMQEAADPETEPETDDEGMPLDETQQTTDDDEQHENKTPPRTSDTNRAALAALMLLALGSALAPKLTKKRNTK